VDPASGETIVGFSKRGNAYFDKETDAQMHRRVSMEKSLAKTQGVQRKKPVTAKKTAKKAKQAEEPTPETVASDEFGDEFAAAVAAAVDAAATNAITTLQTSTPQSTTSQAASAETMLDLQKEISTLKSALEAERIHASAFQELQTEVVCLRTTLAEERQQRQMEPVDTEALRTENQDLRRFTVVLQETISDLKSTISKLGSELDTMKEQQENLQSLLDSALANNGTSNAANDAVNLMPTVSSLESTLEPMVERVLSSILGKGPLPSTPRGPTPSTINPSSKTNGTLRPEETLQEKKKKKKKKLKKQNKPNNTDLNNKPSTADGRASELTQGAAEGAPPSYSNVVQNKARRPPPVCAPVFSDNAVLVAPTVTGKRAMDIIRTLKDVNPHSLGVRQHIEFPQGSVLIRCAAKENALKLRSLLDGASGLVVREKRNIIPEIRVHGIPDQTSLDQFSDAVTRALGEAPVSTRFVTYTNPLVQKTMMGIAVVSSAAYEVAKQRRNIRIGWAPCPVRTTPYISRCTQCHLLGHSVKRCRANPSTETVSPFQTEASTCFDCKSYNSSIIKAALPKSRHRPVDHRTGASHCPSLLALIRRRLPPNQPQTVTTNSTTSSSEGANHRNHHGGSH